MSTHPIDIDALVDSLTLAEQVSLLAGRNIWETEAIERVGIPSMRVSDGPVGARGTDFNGPASVNTPCGTSLAASFDRDLVEEVGHLLGKEARAKGARVLLAPTVNLHRTPIGGRNFECMSEDPYLTAETAVAYVNGLQAEGVASCIKHYVGNDTEFERNTIDSRIDEKTLRELYLVPFEAAVEDAHVKSIMTSYNRVNGTWAADEKRLLADVLRGEWGFDGLVMSDWFGLNSMKEGLQAGCDLEMPGPTRHRGQKLNDAVESGEISRDDVRTAARNVLALVAKTGAFADGQPGPETTRDHPEDRALVRRAGAAGMVLLKNEPTPDGPVLPLSTAAGRGNVLIVGPNAAKGENRGGGSAHVNPTHLVHPLPALTKRFEAAGADVVHATGGSINKRLPELDFSLCNDVRLDLFSNPTDASSATATPTVSKSVTTTRFIWFGDPVADTTEPPDFGARLCTTMTADVDGPWQFGITSIGDATLIIDGQTVLSNADAIVGGAFFGMGKSEQVISLNLEAGRAYDIVVTVQRPRAETSLSGLHLGVQRPEFGDPVEEAIALAAQSDLAIIVVGTNDDWECEGWDRDTIDLPGRQDELIEAIARVTKDVVVVINAGSPVAMPWLDRVSAVVMAWFPGQEMGDSLADVLFGDVEPSGRLPVTFPKRLEDTPAFEHYPGRKGVANYAERRLIGYRWYDTVGREPLFPFGFGLGYASIDIEDAGVLSPYIIDATLTNRSDRDGVQIVQVYAHRLQRDGVRADEPDQKLVGFSKVEVPSGATVTAVVHLDPRGYREWNETTNAWSAVPSAFELRIGLSSRNIVHTLEVTP
jgi:beta-glucosidase